MRSACVVRVDCTLRCGIAYQRSISELAWGSRVGGLVALVRDPWRTLPDSYWRLPMVEELLSPFAMDVQRDE